jgi:GMP synthase-like glutamine amidotransferase
MPEFQADHGNYPEMFIGLLAGMAASFTVFDVTRHEYPDSPTEFDGYIITGSRKSVYDPEAWIQQLGHFVRELHESRSRTVGICFGHQMMATALGGLTEPASTGWRVGVHENQVEQRMPYMEPEERHVNLLVSHKDQVTRLPEGARLLASSTDCPNAMFCVGDHLLAIQGHPEFKRAYSRDLMNYRQQILGPQTYGAGIASLDKDTHEVTVARWIANFLARPN